MRILVTGTEGYIGCRMAPYLKDRGHTVVGLDTGFYKDGNLFDDPNMMPTTLFKDIRKVEVSDLRGFDALVHLAELSNDPLGEQDPQITYKINHQGSLHLARLCKEAGVPRFIYASSCSVYGAAGGDGFVSETSPTNPQTAYADCKVKVETDVSAMADAQFHPTFLRNATAYGASPRMRFDIVLNNLSGLAWTTREIKMVSDGTPWRPLVHILDISKAVACALEAPVEAVHNQIFNVGRSDANYRVREIAEVVAATFPGCSLSFGKNDADNRSYRVSFDKINSQLPGFACEWDLKRGAEELRDVFERIQMTTEQFEFRTFTRLKQLKHLKESQQLDAELYWR